MKNLLEKHGASILQIFGSILVVVTVGVILGVASAIGLAGSALLILGIVLERQNA